MSRDDSSEKLDRIVAQARREREEREKGYRERALKLYSWVCGRCGREFTRANLHELTVHHRDHNHDNNPADGSNWELLCLYCHDNEHERNSVADAYGELEPGGEPESSSAHTPFAALETLLKKKK